MTRRSTWILRGTTSAGVAGALVAVAWMGPSALSASTAPAYQPVAFNLGVLVDNGVISPLVHLEQTVQAQNGNYYVDTDSNSPNYLIEVSGAAPHAVVGTIQLNGLGGQYLGDGVAVGNMLYYRNVTGMIPTGVTGVSACPVIAVNLQAFTSQNATASATSPSYDEWSTGSVPGSISCPPEPAGTQFSSTQHYAIAAVGPTVYWTGGSHVWAWDTTTNTVSAVVTASLTGSLAVDTIGGTVYAFVGETSPSPDIAMYNLGSGIPSSPVTTAAYSWSLPTGSSGLGDFQLDAGQNELWFVREFDTQVGYVSLPSLPIDNASSTSNVPSGQGAVYNIVNAPNGASQAESMTLDPTTGNLWVASGNVNGSSSAGNVVDFGYVNPSSLTNDIVSASTKSSPGQINLTYESTPNLSLGADDFVLVGSDPAYFSTGPILSITKVDNVNHVANPGESFSWEITAGVATSSATAEPGPSSGATFAAGTLSNSPSSSSSFAFTVTDPLPAGVTVSQTALTNANANDGWSCTLASSSTPPTVTCTYAFASTQTLQPGQSLPSIIVPVQVDATDAAGTVLSNTATVVSTDAAPQSATDSVTVVAPPSTAAGSTPPQPTTSGSTTPTAPATSSAPTVATQPTAVKLVTGPRSAPSSITALTWGGVALASVGVGGLAVVAIEERRRQGGARGSGALR